MRARTPPSKKVARPVGHDGHSPVPLFADEHDEQAWDAYLQALREGITPDLAARAIQLTGTAMSRFLNREPDRQLAATQAMSEGEQHYQERLRATARVIALRTAPDEVVPRVLEFELATHVPGYEHLRRDRIKHEGRIEHGVTIDLGKLDGLPIEKRRALLAALSDLDDDVVEGTVIELRELPA